MNKIEHFSPLQHYANLRDPLIYFFSNYQPGKDGNLLYNADETKSDLLITSVDNYYEIKINEKPRILISRGAYQYSTTMAIDNSLADSEGPYANKGLNNSTKFVLVKGTSTIKIQARNQGTCDLLTDIVSHFYAWTGPLMCSTLGYKYFGQPSVDVSDLAPAEGQQTGDSPTLFEVQINLPWVREEMFNYTQAAVKLKNCFIRVNQDTMQLSEST